MKQRGLALLLTRIQAPEQPTVPWNILWLSVGSIIAYILTFFAALLAISNFMNADFDSADPNVIVWTMLVSSLLTLGLSVYYVVDVIVVGRDQKNLPKNIAVWEWLFLTPSKNTPLWTILLMGFGLAVLVSTIGLILGVSPNSLPIPLDDIDLGDMGILIPAVLVVMICRPVVDGVVFQGIIYPALLKQMPPLAAIAVTSVLFGAVQFLLAPQTIWWGIAHPLILGIIATTVRAATKSTQTAIGVHVMFGLFVVSRALLY